MLKRSSTAGFDSDAAAILTGSGPTGYLAEPAALKPAKKNPAAVALGRLGGMKGGRARAEKLSPEERTRIARGAARARWEAADRGPGRR